MRSVLAVACLGVAGWIASAGAADCPALLRGCQAQCERTYPSAEDLARSGCMARCSVDQAACELQRTFDDAHETLERDVKPWIADQAGKWQRFLDGFRGPQPEPPRSAPAPRRTTAPEPGTAT